MTFLPMRGPAAQAPDPVCAAPHPADVPGAPNVRMRFTGTTVLKVENGLITEEIGLDYGVTALRQLGLITKA